MVRPQRQQVVITFPAVLSRDGAGIREVGDSTHIGTGLFPSPLFRLLVVTARARVLFAARGAFHGGTGDWSRCRTMHDCLSMARLLQTERLGAWIYALRATCLLHFSKTNTVETTVIRGFSTHSTTRSERRNGIPFPPGNESTSGSRNRRQGRRSWSHQHGSSDLSSGLRGREHFSASIEATATQVTMKGTYPNEQHE